MSAPRTLSSTRMAAPDDARLVLVQVAEEHPVFLSHTPPRYVPSWKNHAGKRPGKKGIHQTQNQNWIRGGNTKLIAIGVTQDGGESKTDSAVTKAKIKVTHLPALPWLSSFAPPSFRLGSSRAWLWLLSVLVDLLLFSALPSFMGLQFSLLLLMIVVLSCLGFSGGLWFLLGVLGCFLRVGRGWWSPSCGFRVGWAGGGWLVFFF